MCNVMICITYLSGLKRGLTWQAAELPRHSRERLLLVTAYAISIYSNLTRTAKPFKDLQNSTYELIYPERGYRLIGEKVGHHDRKSIQHMLAEN